MVVAYLSFVMVVGPLWMANRKPFKIKNILVGYNAAQVLLSSYMFYEVSYLYKLVTFFFAKKLNGFDINYYLYKH